MLNRRQVLTRLKSPLHTIVTKGDIHECVNLWLQDNKKIMTFISPYRWARLSLHFKTKSIYDLHNLVLSWGAFHSDDPLASKDEIAIANIIMTRQRNRSHSYSDFNGNSSTIFMTLAGHPSIARHIPTEVLPHEIIPLCERLNILLNNYNGFDYAKKRSIRVFLELMKRLLHRKETIAITLQKGQTYIEGDLYFYLLQNKTNFVQNLTLPQARNLVETLLARFVNAAHTCICHHLMEDFFNRIHEGSEAVCIAAKTRGLFDYVDQFNVRFLSTPLESLSQGDLIQQILIELRIDPNHDDTTLSDSTQKILARFGGKQLGRFTINEAFIRPFLENVLGLEDKRDLVEEDFLDVGLQLLKS